MKTKIANFWWQHAHSLGVWWIILGIFTSSYGVYMVYAEGAKMMLGIIVGIAILVAGVKAVHTCNKRKVTR